MTEPVIFKNTTGAAILIPSLGFSVDAGATQDMFAAGNVPDEIFNDDVRQFLASGDFMLNFHTEDLDTATSLLLFDNRMRRPTYRTTTDPTTAADKSAGFNRGDLWSNTTNGRLWACGNYAKGGATWIQIV